MGGPPAACEIIENALLDRNKLKLIGCFKVLRKEMTAVKCLLG